MPFLLLALIMSPWLFMPCSAQPVRVLVSSVPPYPINGVFDKDLDGQFVFRRANGEYVVSFPAEMLGAPSGGLRRKEFPLEFPTLVRPEIRSEIVKAPDGLYDYRYHLTNLAAARQSIQRLVVPLPAVEALEEADIQGPPQLWVASRLRQSGEPLGLEWRNASAGTAPAASSDGFAYRSRHKPGIAFALVAGRPLGQPELDIAPEPVRRHVAALQRSSFPGVRRPLIAVKYQASENYYKICLDYLIQVETLIRSGDLSAASPLVKQLRAGLTSYVEQVRSTTHLIENNTAVPVFEITEKPGTPMEAEIRSALVLSLDRR